MDNNEKFINRVNKLIEQLDYKKLDYSCNDEDKSYAKDFLGKLHSAFIESYGTDYLDYSSGEFVELPAVICGEKTGVIAIGLVNVDLHSSGEHYGMATTVASLQKSLTESLASLNSYIKDTVIGINGTRFNYQPTTRIPRSPLPPSIPAPSLSRESADW